MNRACMIVLVLALCGCATSYTELSFPSDHPANPAAAETVPLSRSRTLDLATAEPITPAPATSAMKHAGNGADADQSAQHGHGDAPATHEHDAPTTAPSDGAVISVCPMHPEVTSDKPDARCPKCGMKLVKKSDAEGSK
jgi:hypothetical protein